MGVCISRRGIGSWMDPLSQPYLTAVLRSRLQQRCKGRKGVVITLTYRRDEYDDALDLYRKQAERQDVPLFIRKLCRARGIKAKGQWFRKMEFQRGGWVHFHVIIMGVSFIPHSVVRECWGHGHVWVDRLTDKSVDYVCKYVAKGGTCPPFLYNEKPRSIKVISVSPGFWRTKSREPSPKARVDPWRGLPVYVPLGEKLERGRNMLVVRDDDGRYEMIRIDLGRLLERLHRNGHRVRVGGSWLEVDCDMGDVLVASWDSPDPGRGLARGPVGLHSIHCSNPDAHITRQIRKWPQWLESFFTEPDWRECVAW